jgi:hypothetical protein
VLLQHIQYAKSKSDLVAKIRGTFVPREKRPREEKPKSKPKKKEAPAKVLRSRRCTHSALLCAVLCVCVCVIPL